MVMQKACSQFAFGKMEQKSSIGGYPREYRL